MERLNKSVALVRSSLHALQTPQEPLLRRRSSHLGDQPFPGQRELASASLDLLCELMTTVSVSELALGYRMLALTQALVFYFYQLLHSGKRSLSAWMIADVCIKQCTRSIFSVKTRVTMSDETKFLTTSMATLRDNKQALCGNFQYVLTITSLQQS